MRKLKYMPEPVTSAFLLFVLATLQGCDDKPTHDNTLEQYMDSNRTHSSHHAVSPVIVPSTYTSGAAYSAPKSTGFFTSMSSAHGSSSSSGG